MSTAPELSTQHSQSDNMVAPSILRFSNEFHQIYSAPRTWNKTKCAKLLVQILPKFWAKRWACHEKNNLRHLKDCATKKGVAFRQEVSQNDPFAPNILKKRGSAPPKTLYLAQRTRHAHENAAPLERSPATLSVRGFFHKQKIKARRTFSYHWKNNKNVVTNSRSTKPCIRTPSVTKLFWDVLGNIQFDPGCTLQKNVRNTWLQSQNLKPP